MADIESFVTLTANTWTLVTSSDVACARIQNVSGQKVWLKGAVGATPPSGIPQQIGAQLLYPGDILDGNIPFSAHFPGSGFVTRVYAYSERAVDVTVSAGADAGTVVTGPSAQSVLNTNLLTGVVSGWVEVSAFNSATLQLIGSAGITAGAVAFEGTNDTTLAAAGIGISATNITSGALVTSASVAANSANVYEFPITTKYIRPRINTAFVGGTVQAVISLSQRPYSAPQIQWAATTSVQNTDNVWYQESVTPQAALAIVTGTARDVGSATAVNHRYSAFNLLALADQTGTARIEVSNDNVTWYRATPDTAVAINTPLLLSIPVVARHHRGIFIVGATLQTSFLFNTSFTAA